MEELPLALDSKTVTMTYGEWDRLVRTASRASNQRKELKRLNRRIRDIKTELKISRIQNEDKNNRWFH